MNIQERKGIWTIRVRIMGKIKEPSFGPVKSTKRVDAQKQANIFLGQIAAGMSYENAIAHSRGVEVKLPGTGTTHADIKKWYEEFCSDPNTEEPPKPSTVKHNLARLKLVMSRAGVTIIEDIDQKTIAAKWFEGKPITDARRTTWRSTLSAVKSVFSIQALKFYEQRHTAIKNPFLGLKAIKPRIKKYSPLAQSVRESIWKDCLTELGAYDAMMVRLALGAGLRLGEIEAALVSWFVPQGSTVNVTVYANANFKPKGGDDAIVSISRADYDVLLKLRGENDSPFFIPGNSEKVGEDRLAERAKVVNAWIKKKGSTNAKPLHGLRKEIGSLLAKTEGIAAAAAFLRNTVAVCSDYYIGAEGVSTPNLEASFAAPQENVEEQALATKWGITLEALLALRPKAS
jgi:integrase